MVRPPGFWNKQDRTPERQDRARGPDRPHRVVVDAGDQPAVFQTRPAESVQELLEVEVAGVDAGEPARLEDAGDRLGEGLAEILVLLEPGGVGDDQLHRARGDQVAELAEVPVDRA